MKDLERILSYADEAVISCGRISEELAVILEEVFGVDSDPIEKALNHRFSPKEICWLIEEGIELDTALLAVRRVL